MPVLPARLGIFTLDGSGRGQAIVLNDDGSLNTAENPAKQGSIIVLFVTGEGLTEPGSAEDHIIGDILPTPKLPLAASILWTDGSPYSMVIISIIIPSKSYQPVVFEGPSRDCSKSSCECPNQCCEAAQFRCPCGAGSSSFILILSRA
jgi:hypothetical protein